MKKLVFILFLIVHMSSYSQNIIWKQYIDKDSTDEYLCYLHTYKENRYILSITEKYQGGEALEDYVISITKTKLNGELLWTKRYQPGGTYYKKYDLERTLFKDSLILIYGICKDSFIFNHKYFLELDLDGNERFSKVYDLRRERYFNLALTDSNTINFVYNDHTKTNFAHIEKYNKKHQLISIDSTLILNNPQAYSINNNKIYTTRLYTNDLRKLGIRLFQYNSNFVLTDSTFFISDIIVASSNVPLIAFAEYDFLVKNNEMQIWGVYDYTATQADNFYFRINLETKKLVENFNSRRFINESYSVSYSYSKHILYNSNMYTLYKTYNKDATVKYKYRIAKYKNGNSIWNIDLRIPDSISIDASRTISLEALSNKLFIVVNFWNKSNKLSELISEYDTNGNYLRSYADALDTGSINPSSYYTIYNTENEILTLSKGIKKGRTDSDLIWKKTSFLPAGLYHELMNTTNPPYPNPTNDILYLNCEVCSTIRVYDLYGKLALEAKHTDVVQLAELPPGIYFVHLTENNQRSIFKVVKN